ncbi:hypothetical protein HNR23_005033 [Nocardiopsis mwathae]|uniref:Uncharacterized protein n=1 Tax=Nocardiopsis mwathae TaxID=1472723 RepID=A0A7W9YMM3_9ACTN|nr:hypothetical protein [Nocardiopsis mwathae]
MRTITDLLEETVSEQSRTWNRMVTAPFARDRGKAFAQAAARTRRRHRQWAGEGSGRAHGRITWPDRHLDVRLDGRW